MQPTHEFAILLAMMFLLSWYTVWKLNRIEKYKIQTLLNTYAPLDVPHSDEVEKI